MRGGLSIGPERAVPVALAASRFPHLLQQLEHELSDFESGLMAGRFVMHPLGREGEEMQPAGLSSRERDLIGNIGGEPVSLHKLLSLSPSRRTLESVVRKGYLQLVCFTPSDAAHVLGMQDNWRRDAAMAAARLLVRGILQKKPDDADVQALCERIWDETVRLTGRAILETALGHDAPEPRRADRLLDAVCGGSGTISLARVSVSPAVPVVAVGGPVRVYYREAGRRLGCEMVFPAAFEVANAVGAASGVILRSVEIEVTGNGTGVFRVHGPDGVHTFAHAGMAIEEARRLARDVAGNAVKEMGGGRASYSEDVEKAMLPDAVDDNGLLRAMVRVEAVASPELSID
jgi:N-methylhydantoinase A/oxoprolinase/acetone carboxylase beta subunit